MAERHVLRLDHQLPRPLGLLRLQFHGPGALATGFALDPQ
jgi:hypothetical protein